VVSQKPPERKESLFGENATGTFSTRGTRPICDYYTRTTLRQRVQQTKKLTRNLYHRLTGKKMDITFFEINDTKEF
jgi:hypothetical protein